MGQNQTSSAAGGSSSNPRSLTIYGERQDGRYGANHATVYIHGDDSRLTFFGDYNNFHLHGSNMELLVAGIGNLFPVFGNASNRVNVNSELLTFPSDDHPQEKSDVAQTIRDAASNGPQEGSNPAHTTIEDDEANGEVVIAGDSGIFTIRGDSWRKTACSHGSEIAGSSERVSLKNVTITGRDNEVSVNESRTRAGFVPIMLSIHGDRNRVTLNGSGLEEEPDLEADNRLQRSVYVLGDNNVVTVNNSIIMEDVERMRVTGSNNTFHFNGTLPITGYQPGAGVITGENNVLFVNGSRVNGIEGAPSTSNSDEDDEGNSEEENLVSSENEGDEYASEEEEEAESDPETSEDDVDVEVSSSEEGEDDEDNTSTKREHESDSEDGRESKIAKSDNNEN